MALENLSERDRAVLRSIFDPTVTIGDVVDDGDHFPDETDDPKSPAYQHSIQLCARGVSLAESGKMAEALQVIDEGVAAAPDRAEGFNDRAQLLRLMDRDDDAMRDLNCALQLTEGKPGRARALALCQKGVLLRKAGKDEEARAAFAEAANLGSSFARKQVVEMNPYAALCNQLLSQVLRGDKEIKL